MSIPDQTTIGELIEILPAQKLVRVRIIRALRDAQADGCVTVGELRGFAHVFKAPNCGRKSFEWLEQFMETAE